MEHKENTMLYNKKKIGKIVLFSFLAVAGSNKIPLNMNNSMNTTFIAKPFY
jgi:hypothetical protein